MAKPAHRTPEPKTFSAAVIEKKPVLFNPSIASVSDYPPLPQRKPVQKQPPKPAPQKPEPVKTGPQKPAPVNTGPQKPAPGFIGPQKPAPVNTGPQKPAPVNTGPQKPAPVNTGPQKPAPVKTVPQKVESAKIPQQVEPVKSAQKAMVKQEAKPAQKQPEARNPAPESGAANKDDKAIRDEASEPDPPPVPPNADGHYELDALTARVLENELEQIMDKVRQALPPEPAPGAERLVAGRFATVAGRDIKNALGLNVTKRLVNQHNPLYVKLVFSGKPEAGRLQPFIAAWRIAAFKRVASPGDTFAARLDAAADFDRICQAKDLTCGSAKVTVTPCYKFLACPPTVKSIYAIANDEAKEKPDSNNTSPQKQQTVEKTEAKTANVDNKVTSKDDSKKEANTTKIRDTKEVDKAGEDKSETPVKNTKVASNPVTVNITIEAQTKSDINKNTSKEVTEVETNKESDKSNVNNQVTNQNKEVKKIVVDEQLDDDGEEMTDNDIFALMSGGIVLDECSGSDDEE